MKKKKKEKKKKKKKKHSSHVPIMQFIHVIGKKQLA